MTWFEASTASAAVVSAERQDVWEALTDPTLLPKLTPFLERVVVDGDHWHWTLSAVPILGISLVPSFTELMTLEEARRIEYQHDPPAGSRERAGVNGWYELADDPGGTRLAISLGVRVDLPFPRVSGPAVRTAMKGVLLGMGGKFSHNLLRHLKAH